MDELEKLYKVVNETKLYRKSFDEFKEKYSDEENINKLYKVVNETKLYRKSFDEFKDKYFNQQSLTPPVSKKAQAVPSGGSESVSANITSSSESVDPNNAIKLQERATKEIIQEYEKQGVKNYNITPEEVNERATVIQLKDQTTPVFDRNSLNLPDKDYQGLAAYEATQKPDYEKFTVEKQKKNFEELANRDTFKYKKSIINEPIDYENTVLNFSDQQKEDIAVQKPETVSKIYGGDLDQYGIDFEDFNGYIEGGNNRIKKLYKDGYFTDDTTDFFKSESDEKLIREVAKNNTLSGYVKDRVDYLNGKYLGLINTNNLEGARKVEDEIKKITKGYQQYVNDKLPTYKKAIDDKLVKEYDEYKNQKTVGGIKKERGVTDLHKKLGDITFGNFFGGIGKATSNITSFALDLVGSEGEAEYQRMIQETNDELDHNSLTYGVVSGKKVNHKGKNLIVSSKGRIIDTDESKDITSIADKIGIDRDTVLEKAKQSEEEGTTYSLMGLISMGASTLGDLAVQLATTKGLLGGANKVSKLKALGTSMAVQSGMVTSSVYEDTLSQLRKANINDEKAIGEALDLSFNAGLLTAGLSIISPDTKALGVSLKGVDKKFSKELAESYVKFGKEGFKRTFAKKAAEKGIDFASEGGKEVLQELGENLGQKKLNEGVNEEVGKDVLDTKITKGEIIETALLSFSTSGLVTALNSKSPSINKDRFGMLEYFAQDVETSKEFINNFKEEGAISESSANDIIKDIETYAKYSNKIPEDTPIEKLDPLLKAVDKRNELELKKKNQDKAFHKEINEEIEKVDEEIAEIRSSKVDKETTKDQEADVDNKTEDVLSDQEYEKMLDDYNTAVEIGAIDESAITELELADRRNAEEGELLQEELELLDSTEKQTGDKYAFIHKNLRGIRSQDYGGIAGDNNLRKDNKSFNILYANKKAIPLDGQAQVMSQKFGDEITPQDIIDYVEDRERNPEKYKTSKDKRKKLEKAIEINFDLESSTDAYKRYMNLDDSKESFEALDKLEDKVLTNEQISIIKKYLKQKGDVKKQLKTNKTTSRGVQQLDETTQRSERRNEGKEENKGVEKVAGTSGTKTKKPTKKTKTPIDESKIEDVDFEEVDGKKEKPKDKVRPEKVIHEEYVDNDGNELIATTTKDGTKTFYYKQKGKSFSFGTGKKKTATQQELVDNGILSTSTTPIKSYTSLDAGKGKSFENDLKQLLQDRIKEIKTQIKEEKKESKRSVLIEELNNKKKQLSSLNKDTTRTNMSQELDEQLDEVIEEISKKESEKETKLTQLQKLNKFISGGRKRVFGFVNKTTLPIVSEIELIGSKLSELQMISKENAKKYKTTYKKALENYIFKSKLDKETAKVNLTGMVKDLMTPVDRNTNSKDAYDQLSKVSKDLADTVIGLRSHIDSFSKIVTEDPAFERMSEESKQNILDNLGDYVHQTYLYFKEKDYNPSEGLINEAIREEAKQIMIDEGIGYKKAIDKATKTVNDLLEKWDDIRNPKNTYSSINTSTNTLSMSDDSLKAKVRKAKNKKLWDQAVKEASEKYPKFKKNHKMVLDEAISIYEGLGGLFQPMPDHIKKLLGDIKLPEDQYLSTMMAVGKMVYKAQALKTINDRFFGEFIFNEKPTKNAKEYVQVNDKSSPLHGKWVNEFIAKEFEQEPIYKANTTVGQIYFNALTTMRKSKILPTSSTWFKNITGLAVFGQILNGNFILLEDPKAFFQSVAGRGKMMFTGNRTKFTKEIFADAAEAGVLSTDINLITMGYIDDMYKQMSLGNESAAINKFDKLQKTIRRGAGKLDKELGQRYAQVDDYGKAMAVYAQKGSMAKKLYGKEYKDLTETERIDVLRQTGNDVKLGNPTFSRLPSWFKDVARFPTGDYVSFQIEATRSFVGAIAIAYNDIKTVSTGVDFRGNKINDVQRKAYLKSFGKRSAGIILIVGFNLLLKHSIESFYRYFSDDDEEEIILKKEAAKLRPFWVDDNLIIENIDEKGNAKFIDYSGQDPYAKTIGMMHLDYSSVKGLFEPNMLISLIREAYGGKTDFGQQLYTKEEHPFFKFLKGVKHILVGGYTPPQAVSMIYGAKKAKKEDENWGSVGDWSRLAASRAAFRKYDFNIYTNTTRLIYDVTDDDSAPKLGYSKNESQMIFRIQNIKKVRDAVNVLNMHYYKNKNKNTNEGVSKFQNALVRNFSSWERNNLISVSEEEFIRQVEDLKKNPQKAIKQK